MKPQKPITVVLGVVLLLIGVVFVILSRHWLGAIPSLFGLSLVYLGYRHDRGALIVFGHACIVIGCFLLTWGIYLLPHSDPTPAHIFGRPLFWGLISIFGGICSMYHGFCRCFRRNQGELPTVAHPADKSVRQTG